MIDSHCHLDSEQFENDRETIIARAREAGIEIMLAIGTGEGPPHLSAAIALAEQYRFIWASVGVHHHHANRVNKETFPDLHRLGRHPKVVAIGEIGLDYHYDFSPRQEQRDVFARQLTLARQLRLPVIIHTREAWADTISILKENGPAELGGIFHCFSEGVEEARQALDLNFHLGFGGVLTFPKAERLREAASFAPLERILLETDAPYLAPAPHRGRRNEPAFLAATAARLADLRGLTVKELDELTTENFRRIFPAALE